MDCAKVRNPARLFRGRSMSLTSMIGTSSPRTASKRRALASAAFCILLVGGILLARPSPLAADTGDKTGWSALTDPRKRAFLIFVPAKDSPRVLNFACLRDVSNLSIYSEAVAGALPSGPATLTLSNGTARYNIAGTVAPDLISKLPTFTGDVADDNTALSAIAAKLLPVLQGSGPILYKIGAGATPNDMSKSPSSIPVTGLAAPLATFKTICFGQ
jgi:hypothetical protein